MTWMIASVLFNILLLMALTYMCTVITLLSNEVSNGNHQTYKIQSQMNSVICQLTQRGIVIKGIWSDDIRLEEDTLNQRVTT